MESSASGFDGWLVAQVEQWLGRVLTADDGVASARINDAAERLRVEVPGALRSLYLRVGEVPCLMAAFQEFLAPEEWELDDGRLVFLVENQAVCAWGVDQGDTVWMRTDDDPPFCSEQVTLAEFLVVVLCYQMGQGGFPLNAMREVPAPDLLAIMATTAEQFGWPLIADHNGLTVHGLGGSLLWALTPAPGEQTADLCLSTREKVAFTAACENHGFTEA